MIYLATDHRGFALKEKIKTWLGEWQLEFTDCGATSLNPDDDYPDFIALAAEKVSQDPVNNRGIILGGNGEGEAMVANRRAGVRAAVVYAVNDEVVKMTREHDASNILSLGASFLSDDDAKHVIKLWLDTPFSEEQRHVRRIAKY
ncbi:MAG TPA: RpiB/LacA/LacB family sugar-phosphate isomerase [Candidatus Paceibacterota bacterium]|nr:RpiB/LacA/LacB family sugar-phosphate isomerase [Candidatus Paceibacterota bacterium]